MAIIGWIAVVVFGIFFLISLFMLCKSKNTDNENQNVYGVEKSTGSDKLYKKLSVLMVIVGIVSAIGCVAGSYLRYYAMAKADYEHYNVEDWLDKAQMHLNQASHKIERGEFNSYSYHRLEAERYMDTTDTPKDYMEWTYHDVFIDPESAIPLCAIALLGILFPLYMLPTKVARKKEHEQIKVIVWLNGVLGCTVICWIAMIIWANSEKNAVQVISQELSLTDKLEEIKKLQQQGLITEEEFESKKKQLLGL